MALWDLGYGAANYAGMDAIPLGRYPSDMKQIADAIGVVWDQGVIERIAILESFYIKKVEAARKAAQNK